MEFDPGKSDVNQFLYDQIDTVPHLEALLLLWNTRPKAWSADDMAKALFVDPDSARRILQDLARLSLVAADGPSEPYRYNPESARDRLIASVDVTYRQELIRVSRLIHTKPSGAVRAFARAFQLKKD